MGGAATTAATLPQEREGHDDPGTLLAVVLALVSFGIVMVWSTSAIVADRKLLDPTFFLRRQVLWAMLASFALALAWATDYKVLLERKRELVGFVALLLVGVLFTPAVNGARRWFDFGGLHAQPSELAKIAAIVYLSVHASDKARLATMKGALHGFGVLALLVGLVAIEPDLGTAAVVAATGTLMLLVAGVRLWHAALLALPAALATAAYAAARFTHVQTRLSVFMNPDADPLGKGYQIRQALIALGSGGPTGLGLGDSKQKLFFLPEDHTDFILAIIGEELGLFGTLAVVLLFSVLAVSGYRIASRAKDRQGFLLAFGVTTVICLQAAMNVAVITASMPTKGISLPFVSFGGSSLLIGMAEIGVLLSVAARTAEAEARERAEASRPRDMQVEPTEVMPAVAAAPVEGKEIAHAA